MIEKLQFFPATAENVEDIFFQAKHLIDLYEDKTLIDYERVLRWMYRKIETNITEYTCVKLGESIVAYYRLCAEQYGYELDDLYVLPPFQNRGIGTAILNKCLSETEGSVRMYVFVQNTGAISLYERFGFSIEEQVSPTRVIMSVRT